MPVADAFDALAEMSTATISDAMQHMGHKNRTMHSRIKPIDPAMRCAGPACTGFAYPGGTYISGRALDAVKPGQVIVIDGQGFLEAVLWGEIFSLWASSAGAAGSVLDGAVRDIREVREMGYPLFSAGIHPGAGVGEKLGEVNIPIQCGGVLVRPGDYVFGDLLGVVVVPAEELVEVHQECLAVLVKEAKMKADIRARFAARTSQ